MAKRTKKESVAASAEASEPLPPEEPQEVVTIPQEETDGGHTASPKPRLDPATRRALRLRDEKSRHRPAFLRFGWHRYKRIGTEWRAPRGMSSKQRRHFVRHPPLVSIGYRGPKAARGLHPSGFREVLVHNVPELEGVDPATEAVRIAHGVGTRKRLAIQERITQINEALAKKGSGAGKPVQLHLLNPISR